MTVTTADLTSFSVYRLALGHIQQFGTYQLGYVYFNYTYTYSGGVMNGQSVRVRPVSTSVVTGDARHGITELPGGGVFNPWGTAGERAPVGFPTYSQRLIYNGNVLAVEREYEKLMRMVGVTANLSFSYGLRLSGDYDDKSCPAVLMPVGAVAERVLAPASSPAQSWIEFTAVWRQVGEFS